MSKQEKLISSDKLLEVLKTSDERNRSVGFANALFTSRDIELFIESGACDPDPVPTIKPGDRGLYSKYTVINNETGKEVEDCFVLKPTKDIAAREALRAYARELDGTLISEHIILWLAHLEAKDRSGR